MKNNILLIGDTQYEVSDAYRDGALAMRARTPSVCNPHPGDTQFADDWSYGHDNEAEGVHSVKGVDVITAPHTGTMFIACCNVDAETADVVLNNTNTKIASAT